MIYFDFEESFLVAGLIIIMLVIGWFTLSLILRQQRKMLFLHPGWIMVTLPVIYGVSTPFFILIGKAKRFGLNPDLLGFYNFNNVLQIMLMYTITLLGFFVAQGFISTINSPVATKQKGRMINGRGDWFLTKTASKVLTFLLLCIVSLGCVSMISYYSHFGGIKEFLSINRVIRYQELHDLGMYSTFNAFFSIGFLVYTYRLVTSKETSRSNWLLMVLLFSFYFFQQTITGSRLGVTTLALGIGFVVF
ncbi:MAG TPA: hypothetical protein DIW17_19520, partial [Clostridiales bacterium]|nr:hypothetical protein [Clostridiales bacterium]